jgi:acyl-CoA dehydrogenase
LDENKLPPVQLLQDLGKKGILISCVPISDFHPRDAAKFLKNPSIQNALGTDTLQRLQHLTNNPTLCNQGGLLRQELAQKGRMQSAALMAMSMANKASVGVATFIGVNSLAAVALSKIATPEQQTLWLNAINHGVLSAAFGLTEENVGADVKNIQTTYVKHFNPETRQMEYILDGNKRFIGNAAQVIDKDGQKVHRGADVIVVIAAEKSPEISNSEKTNQADSKRQFRAFLVPRHLIEEKSNIQPSGDAHNKLGLREVNNGNFKLNHIVVPEGFLLGNPDENCYKKLMAMLDETRILVGAMSVGSTEAVIKTAKDYAKKRHVDGRPLIEKQVISTTLKKLESQNAAAKLLVLEVARLADEANQQKNDLPENFPMKTAMAKLFASELAQESAIKAIDIEGGQGYMEGGDGLAKRLRDTKVLTIYEGPSNIQRNIIIRELLKQYAKLASTPFSQGKQWLQFHTQTIPGVLPTQKLTASTPVTKIEAVFNYCLSDALLQLNQLVTAFKKQGDLSRSDSQNDAFNGVQSRMHLLADIATYRELAQLTTIRLQAFQKKQNLTPSEKLEQKRLSIFPDLAWEKVEQLENEYKGNVLTELEKEHQHGEFYWPEG